MRSLSDLYPSPRAVPFGGETFLVGELRVGDVAELQRWLDTRGPDPLAAVRPLLHAPFVGPGDRHLFSEAIDLATAGPPSWGDERAGAEFAKIEGVFAFLKVVLGRGRPDLTDDRLLDLMGRMEAAEFDAAVSAAYRTSAADELDRAVARLTGAPRGHKGDPPDWPRWIDEVSRSHGGWTYEYIAGLTLTRFFSALNEGKAPRKAGASESPKAARRRWTAWITGDDTKGG